MIRNKEILSDLTIVIFSRNRDFELKKSIKYYESIGVNLVVLHRSSDRLEIDLTSKFMTYVFTSKSYAQRCLEIKNLLTTKYVVLASDDERYLPGALRMMISELENNPEFTSIGGQALALKKYGFRNSATWNFRDLKSYQNDSNRYSIRLADHFGGSVKGVRIGSLYRIYRSKEFCTLMEIFGCLDNISTPYIFECTAEIFAIWSGKFKYINTLFWIRNWNVPMITTKDWDRKLTFNRWVSDDLYREEVLEWKNLLVMKLDIPHSILDSTVQLLCKNRFSLDNRIDLEVMKPNLRINDYCKFLFRFFFLNASLPKTVRATLLELNNNNISVNLGDLDNAFKSMR